MGSTKRSAVLLAGVALALLLSGCGSKEVAATAAEDLPAAATESGASAASPQVPLAYQASAKEPHEGLEKALLRDLGHAASGARYFYNYADLNRDTDNELLVWVSGDFGEAGWFGVYDASLALQYQIAELVPPVVVLESSQSGWADMALYAGKGNYLPVRYRDNGYQLMENSKDNVMEFNKLNGIAYLSDVYEQKGHPVR